MLVKGKPRRARIFTAGLFLFLMVALVLPTTAFADAVADYDFATPIFGLKVAPDGRLLVADAGAGIVELHHGGGEIIASLPGVSDIAPIGRGVMWAVTGGGEGGLARKLFLITQGKTRVMADLYAFEAKVNPDGGAIDSNPFAVEHTAAGKALVVDAAGNSLLVVDKQGNIDWVATFPHQFVSTEHIKKLVGCPDALPQVGFACDLPDMMPAEAVPTSIAVGPDGAYYVGLLIGFPGPVGASQVWRIEPNTLHAECGSSPACSVVAGGFTSIVDLAFGPDGTMYVVEIDEASFMAVELAFFGLPGLTLGGTVNACTPGSWTCSVVASGLSIPTAVAVGRDRTVYVAISGLIPGAAQVIALP